MKIEKYSERLRKFAEERDWDQFHSPKNISIALSVEASELLEHFQWLTEKQSSNLEQAVLSEVAKEIADVQIYLIRLADILGVDIEVAVNAKLDENERKYPSDKVRGSAKKYTSYLKSDDS